MIESPPFWLYIVGFLLLLGPLVTVHEFGHYLMGRLFGVGVEAFSVGFGKEIAGFTDKHGTRWKLSALPLGGYCQFKGDMNPASMPDAAKVAAMSPAERDGSFHHAPLWQRSLIVLAGPLTNIVVALAIFASFNLAYGRVEAPPVVDRFAAGSAAEAAGLEAGDRIVALDGAPVSDFMAIRREVALYPGRAIELTVDREGDTVEIPVTVGEMIQRDTFGNESRVGVLGIYAVEPRMVPMGVGEAVGQAFVQSWQMAEMMVVGIGQIVTGDRSVQELGGPIKIAKFSGEQLSLGPQAFVWFAALISLNLAFINLLPIPALDGGHLAFYAAEAVRRKPIGARGQEVAFRAGVAVILALMVFVTINDLLSLPILGR
ncbi:RIP metalloprotease RseP [Altererythrobacter sp. TH136]|uniref:RIP metalloprotease RseP n=1 Tax=Altererythrobacter sp. TH136 TaxID=2067415 RepID=UPI0011640267|nr:RIP metalloprotease RseP [Altererythrobacter sp. TH136]QDM41914.1 RIP metalloprotease RseP [Altererythrobacter sp. TH136]